MSYELKLAEEAEEHLIQWQKSGNLIISLLIAVAALNVEFLYKSQ